MQILWISHFLPYPPKGGSLQRSYNLIKEISKSHNVYLIAINYANPNQTAEAINHLRQFCHRVRVIDLSVNKPRKYLSALSSLASLNPYTTRWLETGEIKHAISEFTRQSKIDLVHFDSIDISTLLTEATDFPRVLNHHNIESQMMHRRSSSEKNYLKKMYFLLEAIKLRNYEKKICSRFDCNITVSSLDKDRLLRISPNIRIEVVPNGVDTDYFKPENNDFEPNTLVFAGGMNWYPNRDAMLFFCKRIWPLMKHRWSNVKATIIGPDPPEYILELSRRDPNLIVTGFVDDVRPYLERAHVYICPIRDGGGTKLKVLDALAMAKPIVAHPVAVEGIDVHPEKNILLASTPYEFVHQAGRLFEDNTLWRLLAAEGRKLASEKYNFKNIGQKLSKLYYEVGSTGKRY